MKTKIKAWNAAEVQLLQAMYLTTAAVEIGKMIGRNANAVMTKARTLGIRKRHHLKTQTELRPWTASEDEVIKSSLNKSVAQVAEMLGRTKAAVYVRQMRLGVQRGKSRGHMPIGAETLKRGKRVRKISNTGVQRLDWKRVDVIEWEAKNGPVPEGMMLVNKRGMPRAVENLELVSPADLPFTALRHNGSPELRKLLDLKAQFGQALKNIEKLNPQEVQPKEKSKRNPEGKFKKWRGAPAWTYADDEYLRANSAKPIKEIAAAMGRTELAVQTRKSRIGVAREHCIPWTESDEAQLASIYMTKSLAEIAKIIGRTERSVGCKAYKMGLKKWTKKSTKALP
ncbi:hypothetical protein [Delftia sp. GW456-R20]|uniref:hypothetical protein n=1 Tax=Delftia sp. GW456-R20 TaxID=1827145 RepID=UPI0012E8150D|nr:hypothetical protein [Delftia sp. GW456-R20]